MEPKIIPNAIPKGTKNSSRLWEDLFGQKKDEFLNKLNFISMGINAKRTWRDGRMLEELIKVDDLRMILLFAIKIYGIAVIQEPTNKRIHKKQSF